MSFRISKGRKKGSKLAMTSNMMQSASQNEWLSKQSKLRSVNRMRPEDVVNPYLLEKLHIQREEEKIKQAYFRE